jgi:hypothetical protein
VRLGSPVGAGGWETSSTITRPRGRGGKTLCRDGLVSEEVEREREREREGDVLDNVTFDVYLIIVIINLKSH